MEVSYNCRELEDRGFRAIARRTSDYLGLENEKFSVLAKEVIPGRYQIHSARVAMDKIYNEYDINGENFDEFTLDQFLSYLESSAKKEAA